MFIGIRTVHDSSPPPSDPTRILKSIELLPQAKLPVPTTDCTALARSRSDVQIEELRRLGRGIRVYSDSVALTYQNISSDVVYDGLIAEGWQVPDYSLQQLWELLTIHHLAGGMLTHHRGAERHGAYTFQWTDPHIIEEAEDLI